MKTFLTTAAIAALMLGSMTAAQAGRAYIGTYTPDPAKPKNIAGGVGRAEGEGIYLVNVDDATGAVSNPKLMAKTLSPTWMVLSADYKFLYAVNEVDTYGGKSGSVTAFAVDQSSGALKQLNVVDSGGPIPCYISISPGGKFTLVANYTGGSYEVIRIKPDGSLGEVTDVVKPEGPQSVYQASDRPVGMAGDKGPHGSRGHMILPDPTGQYVVGADAGRDQIFVWKLDTNSGKLNQVSVTKSLAGAAPRHFAFAPDGKTFYQQQEQDSRLQVYAFKDGKLTAKGGSVSTLPEGFQGSNTTSELLIDKAGKHLYGFNRNHDTIATFDTTAEGVTRVANIHTEGSVPRSATLSPDGKFVYSLNQQGDNVTTFRIGANGVPKFTGNFLAMGSPAVMVFLP